MLLLFALGGVRKVDLLAFGGKEELFFELDGFLAVDFPLPVLFGGEGVGLGHVLAELVFSEPDDQLEVLHGEADLLVAFLLLGLRPLYQDQFQFAVVCS